MILEPTELNEIINLSKSQLFAEIDHLKKEVLAHEVLMSDIYTSNFNVQEKRTAALKKIEILNSTLEKQNLTKTKIMEVVNCVKRDLEQMNIQSSDLPF